MALQKPDIKQRKYEDVSQMLGIVPTSTVSVNDAYYISSDEPLLGIYTWMDNEISLQYLYTISHRHPFNVIDDIIGYANRQFGEKVKVNEIYVSLGFPQGYGEFQHFAMRLGIRQNGMVCSKENRDIAENIATIVGINVDKVVSIYKCYGDIRELCMKGISVRCYVSLR